MDAYTITIAIIAFVIGFVTATAWFAYWYIKEQDREADRAYRYELLSAIRGTDGTGRHGKNS